MDSSRSSRSRSRSPPQRTCQPRSPPRTRKPGPRPRLPRPPPALIQPPILEPHVGEAPPPGSALDLARAPATQPGAGAGRDTGRPQPAPSAVRVEPVLLPPTDPASAPPPDVAPVPMTPPPFDVVVAGGHPPPPYEIDDDDDVIDEYDLVDPKMFLAGAALGVAATPRPQPPSSGLRWLGSGLAVRPGIRRSPDHPCGRPGYRGARGRSDGRRRARRGARPRRRRRRPGSHTARSPRRSRRPLVLALVRRQFLPCSAWASAPCCSRPGMSLRQAIVAALAGVAISFLPLGLGTLAGKWTGQPTMIVSRATFGLAATSFPPSWRWPPACSGAVCCSGCWPRRSRRCSSVRGWMLGLGTTVLATGGSGGWLRDRDLDRGVRLWIRGQTPTGAEHR